MHFLLVTVTFVLDDLTAEICLLFFVMVVPDFPYTYRAISLVVGFNHLASLLQFASHTKKRPNNLVLGRFYDHHIYDLVEVGIENFRSMGSFSYDKKLAPQLGSKPFFAFIGEAFESVDELKHLKEVLLDLFRGEVCLNH